MYVLIGIAAGGSCGSTIQRKVVTLTNCSEPGQHLTECMVTASESCTTCFILFLTCFPGSLTKYSLPFILSATCTHGEIRLVGGSTDREGRVEVCVGGRRWRTVCTGCQELAGAICSQMGYTFEGTRVD